jgi:hypothetical protein
MDGMAGLPPDVLKAIDLPVRQVRKALRELDPKDVPASLRKVAATEGGGLPPPLLAKLLAELDGNQWLRERLVEQLEDRIEPTTASFLTRGQGWWLDLATAAVESARYRPTPPVGNEVAELHKKLATTLDRLAAVKVERDRLRGELKESQAARARLIDPEVAGAGMDALNAENRRLVAAVTELEERVAAAEQRAESLRLRSREAAPPQMPSHPRPRAVGMGDPVSVGRRLDNEIAALATGLSLAEAVEPGVVKEVDGAPAEPLKLPPGLAPDRPEAIEWLLRLPDPVRVIVDGYNLTYLLDRADFHGGEARRRLVSLLGRLATRRPHRFLVVFDSDQPPGSPARMGDVEVAFTSGEKADDRIVQLAGAGRDVPVVVVTNDRELRERVEAVGALSLWGDALAPHLG